MGFMTKIMKRLPKVAFSRDTLFIIVISVIMVLTGSINTLSTKWADLMRAGGSNPTAEHVFDHPFLQAVGMFVGEMSCFVVFQIWYWSTKICTGNVSKFGPQKFNPLIFLPPALCDMTATSIMYVGLNLTFASSFQMLRGSVIVFTGLLSVAFLKNRLHLYHWGGIFLVVLGLVVVGLGDVIKGVPYVQTGSASEQGNIEANLIITGDLLIVMAQIITAIQMTYEERVIKKYNIPPLQGVGWEGIFGFSVLFVLLFPFYFIPWHLPAGEDFWQDTVRFEDSIDAFHQLGYSPLLIVAVLGTVVSIAFFNFAGLTVTQKMSATTRMVLDSVRTLVIWIISVSVGWQNFNLLQPFGFVFLVIGTFLYYNLVIAPLFKLCKLWPKICMTSEEKASLALEKSLKDSSDYDSSRDVDDKDMQKKPLLSRPINN